MIWEKVIKDFVVLWTTIDPPGTLAIFTALTASMDRATRRQTALTAVFYAGVVLISALVLGQFILAGMGIRLISLQVAGGIVLFLFAMQMIFGKVQSGRPEEGHNIAVFPLAIPAIATPGAIMAVILLTDNTQYDLPQQAITLAMLLVVLGLTFVILILSEAILKVIGKNGATILVKLMGMLLAALSVELIMEALGFERWLIPYGNH